MSRSLLGLDVLVGHEKLDGLGDKNGADCVIGKILIRLAVEAIDLYPHPAAGLILAVGTEAGADDRYCDPVLGTEASGRGEPTAQLGEVGFTC